MRMDGHKGINSWLTALIVMASALVLLFLVCYIMKKRISCKDLWYKLTSSCRKPEVMTGNGRKGSLRGDTASKIRGSIKAKPNAIGPPVLGTEGNSFDAI